MNLNSDDYYSRTFIIFLFILESDNEKGKRGLVAGRGGGLMIDNGFRSPTPKMYSNEQTFIKDNDTPIMLNPND